MLARLSGKEFVSGLNHSNNSINDVQNLFMDHREKLVEIGHINVGGALQMTEHNEQGDRPFVHLHIRRRTIENECRDLCAIFYVAIGVFESEGSIGSIVPKIKVNLPSSNCGESYLEQLVFVSVGEVPEQGEYGRELFMRSVVRLHSLDCCPHIKAQCTNSSLNIGTVESDVVIADRELQGVPIGGQGCRSLVNGNGVEQMIESTTQVMDAVSKTANPIS